MKCQWRSPVALAVLGLLCGSLAIAEETTISVSRRAAGARAASYQAETPFREEPEVAPMPDAAEATAPPAEAQPSPAPNQVAPSPLPPDEAYDSPSNLLPSPEVPDDIGRALAEDLSTAGDFPPARQGYGCAGETCYTQSRGSSCGGCGKCGGSGGITSGITIGGWLDQGITVNGRLPSDRFNGPVTFNDRDGEYQMNQLWLFAEKEIDTRATGFDVGGRVDVLYGTDWRFTGSIGLEDDWNESERFYGLALPQMYVDVGIGDLAVRMGHYYTIIGYEVVAAPDNFFYSHSYTQQYGEPFTHTGLLASYALNKQWTVSAGFDRGWDTWEDNNNDLAYLTGISWEKTVGDETTSLAFAMSTGPYDDAGVFNRTICSIVFTRQAGPLKYVLQHDYGIDDNGGFVNRTGAMPDAEWYGINQYVFYDVNKYWGLGLRVEWFRDDDGTRVGGIGAPQGWNLGPDFAANQAGWAGNFTALTAGINWKPTDCISVRPECRWDWYNGHEDGLFRSPFDGGTRNSQFTFGTDVIFVF